MPHKEAPEPHQDANMPVKEACGDIGFICASGSGLCLPISLVYWDGFKASSLWVQFIGSLSLVSLSLSSLSLVPWLYPTRLHIPGLCS